MRVFYARQKWWEQSGADVILWAEDARGHVYDVIRFHYEDGNGRGPVGWYARAEWLPPGFRRFKTLLSAVRYAGGRELLAVAPPDVRDYEDLTALQGPLVIAHRDIPERPRAPKGRP